MRFRNLIFDLDGTLVDSLPGVESSIRYALQQCHPDRVLPSVREHVGPPIAVMLERMYPELSARELEALVGKFREHYNAEGCRASVLYPEVRETLQELHRRGASLFVLTNKPSLPTRLILEQTGILPYFTDLMSPDRVQPVFPSKSAAAQALADQHQLDAAATVVIGDGIDDANAAQTCGFAFVLARYGYCSAAAGRRQERVAEIDSFREILSLPDKVRAL